MYSPKQFFNSVIPALAASSIFLSLGTAHATPHSNVLLIFNSSGSMKKVVEGQSRMASAKAAVASAISAIPTDTRVGLMVFGHRRAKDCTDIQLVSPIGAESAQAVATHVASLQPKGETPIAAAIEAGAKNFSALKGQNNAILLVTDGIEECGGDPCAAAKQVKASGLDLKVDVVGLNLNGQQRASIECLAKETGGTFFSADKAADFASTLKKAVKFAEALAAPKAEPEPTKSVFFKDGFDGKDLAKNWQVKNPDPNSFVVEKGHLLLVAGGKKSGFDVAKSPNIMQLNHPLPDGDWELSTLVKAVYQTGHDGVWLGLYKDQKNYVAARVLTDIGNTGCGDSCYFYVFRLQVIKANRGKVTSFQNDLMRSKLGINIADYAKRIALPMKLSLVKHAHEYFARLELAGEKDKAGRQIVHKTETVASLRLPGGPALAVGQSTDVKGETMFYIDKVEIDALK